MLLAETNHEKHWAHEPYLMPKEGVSYIVEIINRISVISFLELLILTNLFDLCWKNGPLKIDSIGYIDLAKIDEVMSSFEIFYGLFHELDIEIILGKEILVSPSRTPISCIKIRRNFLTPYNSNILRQYSVHHIRIIHRLLTLLLICWKFLNVSPQIKRNHITHSRNSFISSTSASKRIVCRKGLRNETECMHYFEDVFFDAIVWLGLTGHTIVIVAQVTNF